MYNAAIELTNGFADGTTRKLTIEPLDVTSGAVTNAKTNIKALNADVSAIENYYLSDDNAKFIGVKSAKIVVKEETEIYNSLTYTAN